MAGRRVINQAGRVAVGDHIGREVPLVWNARKALMSEVTSLELFASYDAAVRMAARSLSIARALAEAHRSGLTPPDGILEAYFATLERDEAQLATMRERVQRLRPDARLQT